KEQRPDLLRIEGEKTAEVDYQSMVGHLAYAHLGIEGPAGDHYAIPGLSPESRPGIKKLFSALLFDRHQKRDRLPRGAAKLFSVEDQRRGFRYILERIKDRHPLLVPLFGTGIGHALQFQESKLMVNVILRLAAK